MTDASNPQQGRSEYRRLHIIQPNGGDASTHWDSQPAFSAPALMSAMEKLEEGLEANWMLGGVTIQDDGKGRCWLNVLLKRPPSSAAPSRLKIVPADTKAA
jgi:hypothetical protein